MIKLIPKEEEDMTARTPEEFKEVLGQAKEMFRGFDVDVYESKEDLRISLVQLKAVINTGSQHLLKAYDERENRKLAEEQEIAEKGAEKALREHREGIAAKDAAKKAVKKPKEEKPKKSGK